MAKILFLSTRVLWDSNEGQAYEALVPVLRSISDEGNHVVLVSNLPKPSWLSGELSFVKFAFWLRRQGGSQIIDLLRRKPEYKPSDIVVLGASERDRNMAANSQTLLVRCAWGDLEGTIRGYGVPCGDPRLIPNILRHVDHEASWYFQHISDGFEVYTLTNAGTYTEKDRQMVKLINRLSSCLKDGETTNRTGFQLHLLSSLLTTDAFREADIWDYYPSSHSDNTGSEVMATFCQLARHTFKKRKYTPLFIRHKPGKTRHLIRSSDRTDPSGELDTIHLNPAFKRKLQNKVVVVMDDYLTHGVSFGVANALLKAAGARKVIGVAMGQFGTQAQKYHISVGGDVFTPLVGSYSVGPAGYLLGSYADQAQLAFLKKFKKDL